VAAPLEQDPGPCPGWGPETTDTAAILVVDENDDNRYTLIHRLEREGYTDLAVTSDGREALRQVTARPFDPRTPRRNDA
jgi:PleD family two-component response regulator